MNIVDSEDHMDAVMLPQRVLRIPQSYYERPTKNHINPGTKTPPNTVPSLSDIQIYFPSLFLREFVSTICQLVLNSRLSSDLFIASPIVTLYVNIVFRRPLNSPYVTTLACLSASDWRKANVAGYPGFNKDKTRWWELALRRAVPKALPELGVFAETCPEKVLFFADGQPFAKARCSRTLLPRLSPRPFSHEARAALGRPPSTHARTHTRRTHTAAAAPLAQTPGPRLSKGSPAADPSHR